MRSDLATIEIIPCKKLGWDDRKMGVKLFFAIAPGWIGERVLCQVPKIEE